MLSQAVSESVGPTPPRSMRQAGGRWGERPGLCLPGFFPHIFLRRWRESVQHGSDGEGDVSRYGSLAFFVCLEGSGSDAEKAGKFASVHTEAFSVAVQVFWRHAI